MAMTAPAAGGAGAGESSMAFSTAWYDDTLERVKVWARSESFSRTEEKEERPMASGEGERRISRAMVLCGVAFLNLLRWRVCSEAGPR